MFERILVVCTGNICRSPVAEAFLKQRLPERHISSAGLGALEGEPVSPFARQLAEADGLDVTSHQARQLTVIMIQEADLILVMSEGQRRAVGQHVPQALGKTLLLGRWLDSGKGRNIPDPYRKSREVFEHIHMLLKDAAFTWAERL
ncbi:MULTISPECIES: low molecular weight protein-tyrosine-phosphatase [Halomonadaceae]|jgi:protein-tyrosine phosphatase|uniref:protein-tyrosine-phosphatase n=2 Tax=Vreelandella titanicae TaxID=664683 RepID=L9UBA0_9GAMM|nr:MULTISPECIES: low molecular weight protein-tyrosine-phosphatase [Halomonas]NAO96884.1 low molecular weight phosphotyrosine protein phosphatase [Halomonas sp. MG34]UEQ06163.1 low molecular weight phosphotyrosine protein phosphatase [Halomonas profundus]ELY22235.1 Phosphotyrosine protein phosphatase I superfamily [Halomonas titanicae BH1]KIN14893.1 phosphotyrosine protein phosphatase [Halomonas sp. KHS3]MCD1587341.1 low molecular weight phosphotyrosine protein phosphatase [Halomonas sp. IOP_1|tara:strand:- start:7126 stop:7563 length:438 start_codon:yes stop_codon:yes gene_type:complete